MSRRHGRFELTAKQSPGDKSGAALEAIGHLKPATELLINRDANKKRIVAISAPNLDLRRIEERDINPPT